VIESLNTISSKNYLGNDIIFKCFVTNPCSVFAVFLLKLGLKTIFQ